MILRDLIYSINNAFFRLEAYMEGTRVDYQYFGFKEVFFKLFRELEKDEYYTPINAKLIDDY